jgi:hypothetical protein
MLGNYTGCALLAKAARARAAQQSNGLQCD